MLNESSLTGRSESQDQQSSILKSSFMKSFNKDSQMKSSSQNSKLTFHLLENLSNLFNKIIKVIEINWIQIKLKDGLMINLNNVYLNLNNHFND